MSEFAKKLRAQTTQNAVSLHTNRLLDESMNVAIDYEDYPGVGYVRTMDVVFRTSAVIKSDDTWCGRIEAIDRRMRGYLVEAVFGEFRELIIQLMRDIDSCNLEKAEDTVRELFERMFDVEGGEQ
ncbi:MAG TPA: hypothetical protein VFV57_06075 [Limnobacter sp.]|nr:hypothetical protein [Limnobacter sp.]